MRKPKKPVPGSGRAPKAARGNPLPARVRRTAEDARTRILDATERRLVAAGPSGIRLQDVAKDVGVSHPTILHHFGSRERLVEAVCQRRLRAMTQEVILTLVSASAQGGAPDSSTAVALFERLFQMFGPGGHARVLGFLALEGRIAGASPESMVPLAQAMHAARVARRSEGAPEPPFEETYFIALLGAFALFGEAIVGPLFRGEPEDAPDLATSKRFRAWAAERVLELLERGTGAA